MVGLVRLYIREGTPIGSNSLKQSGFNNISSSTIRNYFVNLESTGYITQLHSSGGRVPTDKAYKKFIEHHSFEPKISKEDDLLLSSILIKSTNKIGPYLREAVEVISELTDCAVFISAPSFDQDCITNIKVISIDASRILCVTITDYGFNTS